MGKCGWGVWGVDESVDGEVWFGSHWRELSNETIRN